MRRLPIVLASAALSLAGADVAFATAVPAPLKLVRKTLTAGPAVARTCLFAHTPGARRGLALARFSAPVGGYLSVRGAANDRSDWDLALYDAATRRGIQASQGWGSHEVTQAWVSAGQSVVAIGCHRSGPAARFALAFSLLPVDLPKDTGVVSSVKIEIPSQAIYQRLEDDGINFVEGAGHGEATAYVTATQLARLRAAGLTVRVEQADMRSFMQRSREADASYAKTHGRGPTPTGRTTYRQYEDFGLELKDIVAKHPAIARPMKLGKPSFQGRELSGVEISSDVNATDDGKPEALIVALHHAREWPAAEAAMEYAHELVDKYGSDARVTKLLDTTRVVIVPLINPDGYISSRTTAAVDPSHNLYENGIDVPVPLLGNANTLEGVAPPGGVLSFRRKNCDGAIPSGLVPCELQYGVDPNRNYGQFWGGPGSSGSTTGQTYRGTGPWSEPETQGVHEWSQTHNVTSLVTIHNVAALVLRPPGTKDSGQAPDEQLLKEVGDKMAAATGYTSQFGFQLYDTSGTTEDWNYAAAGTFGYTIEMGPKDGEFHMPYQTGFIKEWTGHDSGAGKGMRDALLLISEAASDPRIEARIAGRAPAGRTLRVHKDFVTKTKDTCSLQVNADPFSFDDVLPCEQKTAAMDIKDSLDYTTKVPASGFYAWHVTPSTRPFSAKAGQTESWTMTCEDAGKALQAKSVQVRRGDGVTVDFAECGGALPALATAPGHAGGNRGATKKKSSVAKRRTACRRKARRIKNQRKRVAATKRCTKIGKARRKR